MIIMSDLFDVRKKAAFILNSVLAGVMPPETALKDWPDEEKDLSVKAAKHALVHFIDDDDIRRKDKQYEEQQRSLLRRLAADLEKGSAIELAEIQWLTPRNLRISRIMKAIYSKIIGG